jgi:hypothetical protein
MKTTFLLFGLFMSSALNAQIFITSAHFIDVSDVVQIGIDENPSISHTPAGPNQTWGYGELVANQTDFIALGMAEWFNGASNFPNATLGTEGEDGTQIFFRKTTEAFDLMGVYGDLFENGTNTALAFNPYQRQLTFPSTYGTTFTNVSTLNLKLEDFEGADSVVVTVTTHRFSEMDAWGTLTTPFGTFPAIRQHIKDSTIQSVVAYLFGFPVFNESETAISHSYSFFSDAQNARYVLLQYNYDAESDVLSGVQWQMATPVLNSVDDSKNDYVLFPNPSSNLVNIKSENPIHGELIVFDVLGQIIYQQNLKNTDFTSVDVSAWNSGVYFFQITTENSRTTRKITVQ